MIIKNSSKIIYTQGVANFVILSVCAPFLLFLLASAVAVLDNVYGGTVSWLPQMDEHLIGSLKGSDSNGEPPRWSSRGRGRR